MGGARKDLLLLAGCGAAWLAVTVHSVVNPAPPYQPQSSPQEIERFAKATLERVQTQSIGRNREHCGVIIEDNSGALSASQVYDGGRADCSYMRLSQPGSHVIASFHTHGGVTPEYDSEFPSVEDLEGDMDERIDGFIATPGGRVWRTDWRTGEARQLCGAGCIEQDPEYARKAVEEPAAVLSLDDLRRRFGRDQLTLGQ